VSTVTTANCGCCGPRSGSGSGSGGGSGSGDHPAPTCDDIPPGSLPLSLPWSATGATDPGAACANFLSGVLVTGGGPWEDTTGCGSAGEFQVIRFGCRSNNRYGLSFYVTGYTGCSAAAEYFPIAGTTSPRSWTFEVPACALAFNGSAPSGTVFVTVSE